MVYKGCFVSSFLPRTRKCKFHRCNKDRNQPISTKKKKKENLLTQSRKKIEQKENEVSIRQNAERVFFLSLERAYEEKDKRKSFKKQTKSEERSNGKRQNLKNFDRGTDIFFPKKRKFFYHFDKI